MNNIKLSIIDTYIELFTRGEMLKAENFINNCIPLELQEDKSILKLRKECNDRISEIKSWQNGRPYPGTHAEAKFEDFPKFVLARKKIKERYPDDNVLILDIGCYSGVFAKGIIAGPMGCYGIDIHKELVEKLETENKIGNNFFKFGTMEDIPFSDERFNVVTAFDVLEHATDLETAISEVERVTKPGGLIIINLPRMTPGYVDEAFEHLRMFSDSDIQKIWGDKKEFKLEKCKDEFGRPTSFITYIK